MADCPSNRDGWKRRRNLIHGFTIVLGLRPAFSSFLAMTITYADFLQTATDNHGEVLPTAGGRAMFLLEINSRGVCFTPSSGTPRTLSEKTVQKYLDVYNENPDANTSAYTDKMHHASYVLAIIQLWQAQRADALLINEGGEAGGSDPESGEEEGGEKERLHRYRERNQKLARMAKDRFFQKYGRLFCEICDFDFGEWYAEPGFIEAHHRVPLRDLQPGTKTKLSDLVMVCANCHRMLHRGSPWPTIKQLTEKIDATKAKRAAKG